MGSTELKKQLVRFLVYLLFPIVMGSVGYKFIYGDEYSWLDYIYMTVITVSTVGFGEIVDTSSRPEARILTMINALNNMSSAI